MLQSKYAGYDSRNGLAGPSAGNGRPALMMAGQIEVIRLEALLKATEVSALMGISLRHVQRLAKSGEFPCQTHTNAQNRPEYLIPLSALPEQAQKKYIDQHRPAAVDAPAKHSGKKKGPAARPLESYSGEERAEISYWLTLVDRWQEYRRKAGGRKAECDEAFVRLCQLEDPQKRQISVETLYRKWAAIRAGELDSLVDKRGKARKGKTVLLPEIEQEFLSLYLDEAQLPIPRCVALTEQWARENMPTALPLPSYHTFYRKAKAVPYAVTVLCREGEKAYYDKCSPYIRREYESISANDFWIGDTHTLDVESMGPDGTLHRLYLSAWLDARSGIFTGWYVTSNPGSQATLNEHVRLTGHYRTRAGDLREAEQSGHIGLLPIRHATTAPGRSVAGAGISAVPCLYLRAVRKRGRCVLRYPTRGWGTVLAGSHARHTGSVEQRRRGQYPVVGWGRAPAGEQSGPARGWRSGLYQRPAEAPGRTGGTAQCIGPGTARHSGAAVTWNRTQNPAQF